MSASKPWKALERRHAKRMGGQRLWRPDFSESAPDGESDTDVWDTKCYQRFSVVTMFRECEAKYRKYANGRRFSLVLFSREHPRTGDLVLVKADEYARLVQVERAAETVFRHAEGGFVRTGRHGVETPGLSDLRDLFSTDPAAGHPTCG